ncbi:MAG: flagellar hook assembly protein FlgD [Alphaproteobacteria bacterium]
MTFHLGHTQRALGVFPSNQNQNTLTNSVKKNGGAFNSLLSEDVDKQVEFTTKIFLAQLENQIPGDETNTNEMIQTLMGMMANAQQTKTNTLLEQSTQLSSLLYSLSLIGLQGNEVEYTGDSFYLHDNRNAEIICSIPEQTNAAELIILNEEGIPVWTTQLDPSQLKQKIVWDGKTIENVRSPEGEYKVIVNAFDGQQHQLATQTSLKGLITSVVFDENNVPLLMSGTKEIQAFDAISKIIEKHQLNNNPINLVNEEI